MAGPKFPHKGNLVLRFRNTYTHANIYGRRKFTRSHRLFIKCNVRTKSWFAFKVRAAKSLVAVQEETEIRV
eukprot:4480016-Amphidinium_carterae.1